MFSSLLALVLVASVGASRIQVDESDQLQVDESDQTRFGASCEDLQNTFRRRLETFQGFLDANPDLDAIGRVAQARAMMRTYGIVRTLRRARTCSWVVDNGSEELEQARGIVQTLLSGNPCAEAARSELEAGASAESGELELRSIQRAMSILSSDNCEARAPPAETITLDDAQLAEAEDDLQDVIGELEDPDGAAFIQTDEGTLRSFFRAIGVAFLMLILLLACVGAVAVIGALIVGIIAELALPACRSSTRCFRGLDVLIYGGAAGAVSGAVGIAACGYQLYTQLLPRLSQ